MEKQTGCNLPEFKITTTEKGISFASSSRPSLLRHRVSVHQLRFRLFLMVYTLIPGGEEHHRRPAAAAAAREASPNSSGELPEGSAPSAAQHPPAAQLTGVRG